jgi:hypothetical protein
MAPALLPLRPRLSRAMRRRVAALTEPPPCAVCGRGHAAEAWQIDPLGGPHGLCPGCIHDDRKVRIAAQES